MDSDSAVIIQAGIGPLEKIIQRQTNGGWLRATYRSKTDGAPFSRPHVRKSHQLLPTRNLVSHAALVREHSDGPNTLFDKWFSRLSRPKAAQKRAVDLVSRNAAMQHGW